MNATRIALAWVRLYSRGLPVAARAARYAEVESDLWEHRAACGDGMSTQLAMVSRSLRGVPADLAWRLSARTMRLRAAWTGIAGWSLCLLAYLQLVGFHTWSATALFGLDLYGEDWPPGDVLLQARWSALLGASFVVGALALLRMPRLGVTMLAAGSLGSVLAFSYLAPVFVPAGVAVNVGAFVLVRRRSTAPTGSLPRAGHST